MTARPHLAADPTGIPRPFTVEGLADRWSVAAGTIYKMVREGELKAFRAGKSSLRISVAEVLRHEEQKCGDLSYIGDGGAPSAESKERPSGGLFVPRIVMKPSGP